MQQDDVENAISKDCLVSERFSFWLKSPKKSPKVLSTIQQKAQNNDLAPLFGDFSPCEILSEIKPPLGKPQMHQNTNYLFKI